MNAAQESDSYPAPAHGWTCFHCGETFVNPNLARLHFGESPEVKPACFLYGKHPKGLARRVRVVEKQNAELEQRLVQQNEQIETLEYQIGSMRFDMRKYRFEHGAFMAFDELEGRALVAEALIALIGNHFPQVVERARRLELGLTL